MLDWTALSWNWGGGIFKTFLKGSVDHIIYRDYNRRSFIYCSLTCTESRIVVPGSKSSTEPWMILIGTGSRPTQLYSSGFPSLLTRVCCVDGRANTGRHKPCRLPLFCVQSTQPKLSAKFAACHSAWYSVWHAI